MKKSTLILAFLSIVVLILTALAIAFEAQYQSIHIPRMIIGSFVVLFLPGYWITRWTFPLTGTENMIDSSTDRDLSAKDDEEIHTIDGLERFVLSVALSISAVPLLLFYVNFLGVPLTIWSVFYTICGVTLSSLGGTIFIEYRHAKLSK